MIVRQTILEPEKSIEEFDIAHRALGRRGDFNPLDDSIVRVQVAHLRKKLDLYFATEGKDEEVVLTVAMGSYEPVFGNRWKPAPTSQPTPETEGVVTDNTGNVGEEIAVVPGSEQHGVISGASPAFSLRRWLRAGRLAAGLIIVLLAGGCVAQWVQNRTMHRMLYPWKYNPSIAALWSGFLDASNDTDVVLEDDAFLLVQNISGETFSFNDYLNSTYISRLQAQDFSPEILSVLNLIARKNLGRSTEVRIAQRILALDPHGKNLHLYNAREYPPALAARDNLILFGGPLVNPWVQLFQNGLNFTEESNAKSLSPVTNRAPAGSEQSIYAPTETVQYCVIAYLPNLGHNGKVLLIEGTSSEASEAGGDFLLSEDQLSNFQKMLHVTKLPYFEVLLKASQVTGTPLATTIVAYRTYPNLR